MKGVCKRLLAWFDDYFLLGMSIFLLFFIPLMPKIPVADVLPGYIVRMRWEDLLVLLTFVIYLLQVARGKVDWKIPTWRFIFAYVFFSFLSVLSGIFVIHTIPFDLKDGVWSLPNVLVAGVHVAKSLLHWARYIEYFFLAFLFYSTVRTKKTLQVIAVCLVVIVAAISIYGWGQKYWYWPVYSTMNREFSKGVPLMLTPHARVQSTFGGHYDFAAYLVLLLPFLWMIARHARQIWSGKWGRVMTGAAWVAHFMGVWSLIISAARTSILAYGVSIMLLFVLDISLQTGTWSQKLGRWVWQQAAYWAVVSVLVFGWGGDMIERFEHPFDSITWVHNSYQVAVRWREELPQKIGWRQSERPEGVIDMGEFVVSEKSVLTPTDTQPSPVPSDPPAQETIIQEEAAPAQESLPEVSEEVETAAEVEEPTELEVETSSVIPTQDFGETTVVDDKRPADVYVDVPDLLTTYDASGNAYTYEATRTWSANAEKYGLSMAIRLDTLWPNAIAGFSRNPLLGSGYGTLTKGDSLAVFTEADSTDCNFLRTLGETGLIGFICFYAAMVIPMVCAWKQRRQKDPLGQTLTVAYFGAMVGILLNALYIDVFAASKVAFSVWTLTGIFWATQRIMSKVTVHLNNEKMDL